MNKRLKNIGYGILAVVGSILLLGGYLLYINVLFYYFPNGPIAHFFGEKFAKVLTAWTGDPILVLATLGKWGIPIILIMLTTVLFVFLFKRRKSP